jgi:hypothetical protein
MREFETGGSSSTVVVGVDFEEGNLSRETPTQSSSARNWRREEYGVLWAAREIHTSRRIDEGIVKRPETA